jgi:uncharacterized protein YjbI with pentapeptide repeats
MANTEHLEILKQGVDVWNRWREDNPDIIPDLNNADLRGFKLDGADLRRANLREAKLCGMTFSKTIFSWADLSGADVSKANFSGADLWMTDFIGANLVGANLSGVDLQGVQFTNADLRKANFCEASLRWVHFDGTYLEGTIFERISLEDTLFGDVDLSTAVGLESVHHDGPSSVGIDTIYRSGGKIPEVFLRGCGIPENFIQYMSSLTAKAFEYYSCFISYSSKDQDFAERIYADLQNKGVRCWFAPEDMKIGDKIRDRIDRSIRIHDKLLLVLSEHSINSEWVEDEVETAYEQERKRGNTVLFPIRLDDAVIDTGKAWASKLRRSSHIGDFTRWKDHDAYQKAFDRLMRDLKSEEPAGSD